MVICSILFDMVHAGMVYTVMVHAGMVCGDIKYGVC